MAYLGLFILIVFVIWSATRSAQKRALPAPRPDEPDDLPLDAESLEGGELPDALEPAEPPSAVVLAAELAAEARVQAAPERPTTPPAFAAHPPLSPLAAQPPQPARAPLAAFAPLPARPPLSNR